MDLFEACENGNEERVVELLLYGDHWRGHSHPQNRHGSTMAYVRPPSEIESTTTRHQSITATATKAVATVLSTTSPLEMLKARGTAGRTPLLAACMNGQVSVVRLLLGESCPVYFTSRTMDETKSLLEPLVTEYVQYQQHHYSPTSRASVHLQHADDPLFHVTMATKDGGDELLPVATVRLTPSRTVSPQDLLEGKTHVDTFGNTPLQCISCFGCGSTVNHIENGLEITKQLLLHGDQPNIPKIANQWTPLHWAAFHGNHEQCALLLYPITTGMGKTQQSITLLQNSDHLFAVDVAGRRGLALLKEMHTIQMIPIEKQTEFGQWRLRLNHIKVLQVMVNEFIQNATSLIQYANEMNARQPRRIISNKKSKTRLFTCHDVVRYGQHLLYWLGCFGLQKEIESLLTIELTWPMSLPPPPTLMFRTIRDENSSRVVIELDPLYICCCEENKRQSVLHAVAVHGRHDILALLLDHLCRKQIHDISHKSLDMVPHSKPTHKNKHNAMVVPVSTDIGSNPDQPTSTQLDVLGLTGWRNYRNESPLYLAVLYLQHDAVALLARVLTRRSIEWELCNSNVEGSFIYHVASEETQTILDLKSPHSVGSMAEYVMLFDGITKKNLRDSMMESMREESVLTPSLVVTRAGSKTIPAQWFGLIPPSVTDYVVLGATEDVLISHAQFLQLKVKHRGSALRSRYNASTPFVFEPFRSLQRQQVVLDIIYKSIKLKKHLQKRNIMAIFPLHDASGCQSIMRHWVYQPDTCHRVFQPFSGTSLGQFLYEHRSHPYEMLWPLLTYFGEKHAFYYAFLMFYTVWLLLIALPGILTQFIYSYRNEKDTSRLFVAPLFAIIVSLWATLFVERWKRKKSEIQCNFGHFKRNRNEQAPDFYGDFQVQTIEKAIIDKKFPKTLQLLRIYMGIPVLFTMASLAVLIFISVKLHTSTSEIQQNGWLSVFPSMISPYIIPILNAISMLVLDTLYTQVALALTHWENHRTVWEYESMLATKLFWFKFLNAFMSLFWVAFIDQDTLALRKQLVIIMGARQLTFTVQRHIIPLLQVTHRWKQAGFTLGTRDKENSHSPWTRYEWYHATLVSTSTVSNPPPPMVLLQELMLPPDLLMTKQMEIVLQFGYITMFVSVLPIAPLLALISNIINTRLDVICCTQVKRRPPFESETEVSTFMSILEFMSFAAVAVNCAVLFFTTRDDLLSLLQVLALTSSSNEDGATSYLKKLWILLIIEHVVLGIKALLSLTIDDAATWVQHEEEAEDDDEKETTQAEKTRLGTLVEDTLGVTNEDECAHETKVETNEDKLPKICVVDQILKDKYTVAIKERDEALERERQLKEQFKVFLEQQRQHQCEYHPLSKPEEKFNPWNVDISTIPSTISHSHPTERSEHGTCRICFLLQRDKASSNAHSLKRCLTCREYLCQSCDNLVHLDDLGVREALHFRVNVPTKGTAVMENSTVVQDGLDTSSNLKEIEPSVLHELNRLLRVYSEQHKLTNTEIKVLIDRCSTDTTLIIRYLRNYERKMQRRLVQLEAKPNHRTATKEDDNK